MVPVISANASIGLVCVGMALGWALDTWVMARLTGMVWHERP
jgi:hypothetical protein